MCSSNLTAGMAWRRRPMGVLSGVFSWILAHAQDVTTIAGLIGASGGALLTLMAVAAKLYNCGCRVAAFIRRRRRNRRARLEHDYDPKFDAGLQDDKEDL